MNTKLEAEQIQERLYRAAEALARIKNNRAYTRAMLTEADTMSEQARKIGLILPGLTERISTLELLDPLGHLRPNEQLDVSIQLENLKNNLAEIEESLIRLLENVEGQASSSRWIPPREVPQSIEQPHLQSLSALIVGVSNYTKAGMGMLTTPRADALVMRDLLMKIHGQDHAAERICTLVDDAADRAAILSATKDLGRSSADLLVFYFSGHGLSANGQAILLPYDYNIESKSSSAVHITEITQLLRASRASSKVIILDACHSGPDIDVTDEETKGNSGISGMDPDFFRRVFDEARGLAVITSCVAAQVSWTFKRTGLSCFTYFLSEGLRGAADTHKRGFVTVSDLFHYLTNSVRGWAEERGKRQTPALSYTTTGEIVLAVCG